VPSEHAMHADDRDLVAATRIPPVAPAFSTPGPLQRSSLMRSSIGPPTKAPTGAFRLTRSWRRTMSALVFVSPPALAPVSIRPAVAPSSTSALRLQRG